MTTTTLSPLRPKLFRGAIAAAALAVAAVTLSTMSTPQAIESPPQSTFVGASFADVIERAQPAVVKIDVKKVVAGVARLDGREMPFAGSPTFAIERASPSGSVSLSRTRMMTGADSPVVAKSSVATGASFTDSTLIVTVAVSDTAPSESTTTYRNESSPAKSCAGL